jgi:hypothetical protein
MKQRYKVAAVIVGATVLLGGAAAAAIPFIVLPADTHAVTDQPANGPDVPGQPDVPEPGDTPDAGD